MMEQKILYEKGLQAFQPPVVTPSVIIRPWMVEDAPAIAVFFNADDQVYGQSLNWGKGADYSVDYIKDSVLETLGNFDRANNRLRLGIFTPYNEMIGVTEFYTSAGYTGLSSETYLKNSHLDKDLAEHIYYTALGRLNDAGIISVGFPRTRQRLRTVFERAMHTQRLTIRPLTTKDEGSFRNYLEADDHDAKKDRKIADYAFLVHRDRGGLVMFDHQDDLVTDCVSLGVFDQKDGHTLLGKMTLSADLCGRPRLGYYFKPSSRGQGFAREAHRAMLAWTDVELPTPIRVAEVDATNIPSIRLLEKAGFRQGGTRKATINGMQDQDVMIMHRQNGPV